MQLPNISEIEKNSDSIVPGIGSEAVRVYCFLADHFANGSILENHIFQFVYRSFYRLDNAGLSPEFKSRYFELLEGSRNLKEIDLGKVAEELYAIPNRKGQPSLQFSFVTKLGNMANHDYPIYDREVASVFGFRPPDNVRSFDARLKKYMAFYTDLRATYAAILSENILIEPRKTFRRIYAAPSERVPDVKVLDFIFWSAGKRLHQERARRS